jgi:hypothetical protein
MTSLNAWRAAFARLDACPWPGPKPLLRGDADQLVGREEDLRNFKADIVDHSLIVLTGDSGVGKSSFLNAGLIDALKKASYVPFVCNDWAVGSNAGLDPESFIAAKVATQLPEGLTIPEGGTLTSQLEERFRHKAVLILDQFEELMRYQPQFFEEVTSWLAELTYTRKMHIVLSLRAEFTHRLDDLRSAAKSFKMAEYVLEPLVSLDVVHEIIRRHAAGALNTAEDERDADAPISEDAIAQLEERWETAQMKTSSSWEPIGLLHLQAALYSLYRRADGEAIQVAHLREMAENSGGRFFQRAIVEAVHHKLRRCITACKDVLLPAPLDAVLVEGTAAVVQRLVPHLSSGGYKIPWEEWDLARLTLDEELERLACPVSLQRSVFQGLRESVPAPSEEPGEVQSADDLLSIRPESVLARTELAGSQGAVDDSPLDPTYLREVGLDVAPWVADPNDVTSGPMLGLEPHRVLVEELRRFIFALEWLQTASLIRASASSPVPGQTMLSLIHDGFGSALREWSAEHATGPAPWLNLLTGAYGKRFLWKQPDGDMPVPEFDGTQDSKLVVNVRWRDSEVEAAFRRLVFINCDFRGTRFENSTFEGVVLINCLLDGAAFSGCKIVGRIGDVPPERLSEGPMPDFWLPMAVQEAEMLALYRGIRGKAKGVFSITSGVPALPAEPNLGEGFPWNAHTSGLSLYGGRLSSLMIRRCHFDPGAELAFRHIAGSSLDLVEQSGGRLSIFDSVIRGLTITSPVEERRTGGTHSSSDGQPLVLHVKASVLADTWFGDGLQGRAEFEDCKLWQLWNAADRNFFDVGVSNCAYYGLVNVAAPDAESLPLGGIDTLGIADRESVAAAARRMDYRSTPARLELEDRLAQLRGKGGG